MSFAAAASSDPLTAPTWLTAALTGVLAAGAIVTAVFAYLAFRKQAAEVSLLQQQAKDDQDDRRREADERRRQRASLVYLATSFRKELTRSPAGSTGKFPPVARARIHNAGGQPLYDVRVHWVAADTGVQAGAEDVLGNIAPGQEGDAERELPLGTEELQLLPVAYFGDAAGIRWTLLDNGELNEVDATYPAGAPPIATDAVARARKKAEDARQARAALTDAGEVLAEAAKEHPSGTRRHGFRRTPNSPGK